MRESIGGTWLLGFVVLFIVLFSGYLAVSINYTKAFKAKNQIINIIEQNEGFSSSLYSNLSSTSENDLEKSDKTEDKVYHYLTNLGYATTGIEQDKCDGHGEIISGGYCVKRTCTSQGAYYKVTTFIKIEFPIIWESFTIPISGETKIIYYDKGDIKGDGCNPLR